MLTCRDFVQAFRDLGIDPGLPVIAHASLSAFKQVQGGAETVVGALLKAWESVVMPAFTYRTMLVPETGPDNNAIVYGSGTGQNRLAQFFTSELPADRMMGAISEALRRHPLARRSDHPILSFTGVNAQAALKAQTRSIPLAPIRVLCDNRGWVLLLGVGHTVNTSIHWGELQAGRKTFVRWALTRAGVEECPGFPSCSDGFEALTPALKKVTRSVQVGPGVIQAVPLEVVIEAARSVVAAEPFALLCSRSYCGRCNAIRREATGERVLN